MATRTDDDRRERPIGELMRELADETSTLVRQELELARAEMTQKGREAGVGIGMVGAAGIAGLAALGALTAFFILALDGVMPNWAAALVVAVVYAAVAGFLYLQGRDRVKEAAPPVPEETQASIQEDVETAKAGVASGRR